MSKDLFAPPSDDELMAPPSEAELKADKKEADDLFAPPSAEEVGEGDIVEPSATGGVSAAITGPMGYKAGQLVKEPIANAVNKAAAKAVDTGISLLGGLKGGELEHIRANPHGYESARALDSLDNPLEDIKNVTQEVQDTKAGASKHITNNLRKTAKDVHESSYKLANEAKDSLLRESTKMDKRTYLEGLLNGLKKSSGAFNDVSPADQNKFITEQVKAPLTQHQAASSKAAQQLASEVEILKSKLDPNNLEQYIDLNKQIKAKELQLNSLKTSNPLAVGKIYDQATEAYNKSIGIPQELLDIDPSLQGKSLNPDYSRLVDNAVNYTRIPSESFDPNFVGGKEGLVDKLRDSATYAGKGDATTAQNLSTNMAEGVRRKGGELWNDYDQKMGQSSKAIGVSDALADQGIKIGDDKQPVINTSRESRIEDMYAHPDKYQDESRQLNDAVDKSRDFSKNQPLDLAKDRLQQATRLQDELEKYGLKVDANGKVSLADSNKIIKYSKDAKETKLKELQALIDEANTLSANPAAKSGNALVDEVKSSLIKDQVNAGGEISQRMKYRAMPIALKSGLGAAVGAQVGGGQGAAAGAAAGAALDVFGNKLQEKAALMAGKAAQSGVMKGAGYLAKEGIPILGGLASGYMGYKAAQDFFPKAGAATIGAAEAVNPIPFTDVATGAIEAKKDYEQNNSIPSAAMAGAAGFVKPAVTLANMVGENKSNEARARMEQNMNAGSSIFNKKDTHQDFKSFVEKNPESLRQLADKLTSIDSKAAQTYAAPLMKAAESDDRSRAAILFGLYQQPAFRQLQKDVDAEDEESPWTGDLKK
jgi:hypothetical protein